MATIADSIRKSSLSLSGINNSLNQTKKSTSAVNDSVSNISRIISTNARTKQTLYEKGQLIKIRRSEASRRKENEDRLESKRVSFNLTRGLAFASRSQGSPFARLVGFLGFITSGWIVENLPTWIFMGKEFVRRVYTVGGSMSNMMGNFKLLFNFFTSTLKNSFDAIVRMDFRQFSEGNVAESFQGMVSTIEKLGENFNDIFSIFRTPLTESPETGEQAPGLGETRTESLFPGVQQETNGGRVTGIHKQALDAIAKYESISSDEAGNGYNAMNQGGNGMVGIYGSGSSTTLLGKALTQMTVAEVMERQRKNNQYSRENRVGIFAAGRYQIIPDTLKGIVDAGAIKPSDLFDQRTQDKAGLYLIKTRGVQPWGWDAASRARFTASERAAIERARTTPVTYTQATRNTPPQPQQTVSVPRGKIIPTIGDRLGAGRNHGGVDLQVENGTPLRAISDGVIVDSDYEKGWGNFLVMRDNLGIYHLYGHMQSEYKRSGPVKKGEIIGKVGISGRTTGPHLHWEAGTGWNGGVITGKFDALTKYSKFAPFNTEPSPTIPQSSTRPTRNVNVQISPPPPKPSPIIPERQGSNIFVIDTQQQLPQPQYIPPAPQMPVPMTIDEYKLLNNFMKNKLLLDLAYL